MKRKLTILALLGCALALSARADDSWTDWFSGTTGPKTAVGAEWEGSVLTPTVDAPATNTLTRVTVECEFVPYDMTELVFEDATAQTALVVGYEGENATVTNFYAYLGNDWVKLSGPDPSLDQPETVEVCFNYATTPVKVSFKVVGTQLYTNETAKVKWFALTTEEPQIKSIASEGGELDSVEAKVKDASAEAKNGLTYLASYVLNLDPTDETATLKATAVENPAVKDGNVVKIKVGVPAPRDGTGYSVTYKVYDEAAGQYIEGYEFNEASEVKIPAASGRYRVDAEISKD